MDEVDSTREGPPLHHRALTKQEGNLLRQLMVEAVPFAFEKCLADSAVQSWAENIQRDILHVCHQCSALLSQGMPMQTPQFLARESSHPSAGLNMHSNENTAQRLCCRFLAEVGHSVAHVLPQRHGALPLLRRRVRRSRSWRASSWRLAQYLG